MKNLIILITLFSSLSIKADPGQALNYLASQGWANDHFDAYQFRYNNKPTPEEAVIKAYQETERNNAMIQAGYGQGQAGNYGIHAATPSNCYFDHYSQEMKCN